jgi:hypothetical protein
MSDETPGERHKARVGKTGARPLRIAGQRNISGRTVLSRGTVCLEKTEMVLAGGMIDRQGET